MTFVGAASPKSLAASFRFQSCCLRKIVSLDRYPSRQQIARHFRSLCEENRSPQWIWGVQATFHGVSRPKSLAASFRFQSCGSREVVSLFLSRHSSGSNCRSQTPINRLIIFMRAPAPRAREPAIGLAKPSEDR